MFNNMQLSYLLVFYISSAFLNCLTYDICLLVLSLKKQEKCGQFHFGAAKFLFKQKLLVKFC